MGLGRSVSKESIIKSEGHQVFKTQSSKLMRLVLQFWGNEIVRSNFGSKQGRDGRSNKKGKENHDKRRE